MYLTIFLIYISLRINQVVSSTDSLLNIVTNDNNEFNSSLKDSKNSEIQTEILHSGITYETLGSTSSHLTENFVDKIKTDVKNNN